MAALHGQSGRYIKIGMGMWERRARDYLVISSTSTDRMHRIEVIVAACALALSCVEKKLRFCGY